MSLRKHRLDTMGKACYIFAAENSGFTTYSEHACSGETSLSVYWLHHVIYAVGIKKSFGWDGCRGSSLSSVFRAKEKSG